MRRAKAAALEQAIDRLTFTFRGRTVTAGASAGVAILGPHAEAGKALEEADSAMYVRKAQRRHEGGEQDHDHQTHPIHASHPGRRHRRSPRPSCPHALSRPGARRGLGLWHRCRLSSRAHRILARRISTGGRRKPRSTPFRNSASRSTASTCITCMCPASAPTRCRCSLLHGWPGSVFEFLEIIPRLTDPARFGGDARDAFTVVAPSLPGYGLSFQPGQKRFGVPEMADCVAALMHDVLGYAPLRRARRRLGRRGHQPARLCARGPDDRHPHQSDDGRRPRSRRLSQSDRGGAALPRRAGALAARGDRLSVDPGHAPADACLRR